MSLYDGIQLYNVTTGLVAAGMGGLQVVQVDRREQHVLGAAPAPFIDDTALSLWVRVARGDRQLNRCRWQCHDVGSGLRERVRVGGSRTAPFPGYPQHCPHRAQPPGHRSWDEQEWWLSVS